MMILGLQELVFIWLSASKQLCAKRGGKVAGKVQKNIGIIGPFAARIWNKKRRVRQRKNKKKKKAARRLLVHGLSSFGPLVCFPCMLVSCVPRRNHRQYLSRSQCHLFLLGFLGCAPFGCLGVWSHRTIFHHQLVSADKNWRQRLRKMRVPARWRRTGVMGAGSMDDISGFMANRLDSERFNLSHLIFVGFPLHSCLSILRMAWFTGPIWPPEGFSNAEFSSLTWIRSLKRKRRPWDQRPKQTSWSFR